MGVPTLGLHSARLHQKIFQFVFLLCVCVPSPGPGAREWCPHWGCTVPGCTSRFFNCSFLCVCVCVCALPRPRCQGVVPTLGLHSARLHKQIFSISLSFVCLCALP